MITYKRNQFLENRSIVIYESLANDIGPFIHKTPTKTQGIFFYFSLYMKDESKM